LNEKNYRKEEEEEEEEGCRIDLRRQMKNPTNTIYHHQGGQAGPTPHTALPSLYLEPRKKEIGAATDVKM